MIESDAYQITKFVKDYCLSKDEIDEIFSCVNWIKINANRPKDLKTSEILNTLTLSFWVLSPSQVHLRYKFGDDNSFSRMLDRFQFINVDKNKMEFDDKDLKNISRYYKILIRILRKNKRLNTAVHATYLGAISYSWKAAFVLFSAAFEALLTYSSRGGITKRLSKSYACLVEKTKRERDKSYRKFNKLYGVRSDIMHGRIPNSRRKNRNLKELYEYSHLLRKLWKVILNDPKIMVVLEMSDTDRKRFFDDIELGYTAPL